MERAGESVEMEWQRLNYQDNNFFQANAFQLHTHSRSGGAVTAPVPPHHLIIQLLLASQSHWQSSCRLRTWS
jgi:hypothetical protein